MTTGKDILREAVRVRSKKANLGNLARDISVAASALDDFGNGQGELSSEVLQRLAVEIFQGRAEFDPVTNLLRSANKQEAVAIGPGPGPIWEWMELPQYEGGPPPLYPADRKPPPKAKRPGWA